jgi:hypothetical protein
MNDDTRRIRKTFGVAVTDAEAGTERLTMPQQEQHGGVSPGVADYPKYQDRDRWSASSQGYREDWVGI